jgi:hypothetical protein
VKAQRLIVEAKKKSQIKKPSKRQKPVQIDFLEQYITSGEQGELPKTNAGADVTQPLNADWVFCTDTMEFSRKKGHAAR